MAISGARAAGDELSMKNAKVEIDLTPASSAFVVISTWTFEVSADGGTTPTSNRKTFDGSPIVIVGDREPRRLTFRCTYTDGDTDPFDNIFDAYEAVEGGPLADVRYTPAGGGSAGQNILTTSGGRLIDCTLPQGVAGEAEIAEFSFTIECSQVLRTKSV